MANSSDKRCLKLRWQWAAIDITLMSRELATCCHLTDTHFQTHLLCLQMSRLLYVAPGEIRVHVKHSNVKTIAQPCSIKLGLTIICTSGNEVVLQNKIGSMWVVTSHGWVMCVTGWESMCWDTIESLAARIAVHTLLWCHRHDKHVPTSPTAHALKACVAITSTHTHNASLIIVILSLAQLPWKHTVHKMKDLWRE